MNKLTIGPLSVTLHRTIRVAAKDVSNLPPSLGALPIYKVADYKETCPSYWEEEAVFVALHNQEAVWLSFENEDPLAVLIGAGGVNALNGEKLELNLKEENYIVTPPQPWLDGWKDKDGTVYQFVSTTFKDGEGLSVGEQLHKEECSTGGMGIAVFEAKDPVLLHRPVVLKGPEEIWGTSSGEPLIPSKIYCCSLDSCYYSDSMSQHTSNSIHLDCDVSDMPSEMAIGKGGKITQKIYPDPYGIDTWKKEPIAAQAIYLINSEQFSKITGLPMPDLPRDAESYYGKWFGLKDESFKDIAGSEIFTGLKTVFHD